MTTVLREHAEQQFADELHELAQSDTRQRPPNWKLSPWAVATYLLGGTLDNGFTVPWTKDYPVLNNSALLQPYLNQGNRKNDLNNLSPRVSMGAVTVSKLDASAELTILAVNFVRRRSRPILSSASE